MRLTVGARGFVAIGVVLSLLAAGLAAAALSNRARPASSASSAASELASASAVATGSASGAAVGNSSPQASSTATAPWIDSSASAPPSGAATGAPTGSPTAGSPSPSSTFTPTATALPTNPPPLPGWQPSLPARAAFYYPLFPEGWNQQGMNPFTQYHPSLGFYDSSASATIHAHIGAMQYAGVQVAISSWWGVGTNSDTRLPTILANTAGSAFRWTVYYEEESQGDPAVAQLASDLRHIRDLYAADASFFKINGRFVVFVYSDGADACGMATRWAQANAGINAYVVLKVFTGFKSCADQPAGWHQYSPSKAADSQIGYSYAIGPGFWKANEASPRLGRDLARWAQNVRDMVASGAPFQLVTTFNEWGEGTSVESATEWATASGYGSYLDLLHTNGQ